MMAAILLGVGAFLPVPIFAQPCATPPPGVVAWWPGDGRAADLTGANPASLPNGVSYTAGRVGRAFNLGGPSDHYVAVPNSPALHTDRQLTVMGWFRANALSSEWQTLVWKGNTPDCTTSCENREYGLWINRAGYLHFASTPVDRIGVGQLTAETPAGQIVAGQWYHFAAVINCDANMMGVFLNGTHKVTTTHSPAGIRTSTGYLYLGVTAGGGNQFGGLLDEVAILNRALSSNEIAAIYLAGSNGICRLPPTVTGPPTSQIVTEGGDATFVVAADGVPVLHYQWRKGTNPPVNITGATSATYTIARAGLSDAGLYSVVVSNLLGSVTSSAAIISVFPDTTPPTLVRASGFGNAVSVSFSEPVDPTTAQAATNYALTNALGPVVITSALLCGESNVLLTTPTPLPEGMVHGLIADHVTDTAQTPNAIAPKQRHLLLGGPAKPLPRRARGAHWPHQPSV